MVGGHGPLLSLHPHQACFSPSHSHQEAVLAIGDATTVMGGQVRGGLGKGVTSLGRGLFLSGFEAVWELCRWQEVCFYSYSKGDQQDS